MSLQIKFILVLYLRKPGFIFSPFHAEIMPPSRRKRWAAPWDWDGGGEVAPWGGWQGRATAPARSRAARDTLGRPSPEHQDPSWGWAETGMGL